MKLQPYTSIYDETQVIAAMKNSIPESTKGKKRNFEDIAKKYPLLVTLYSTTIPGPGNMANLRLDQLRKAMGTYRINKIQYQWLDWFSQHNFSLYEIDTKGNNIEEEITTVKLNANLLSAEEILHWDESIMPYIHAMNPEMRDEGLELIVETPIDMQGLMEYITSTLNQTKTGRQVSSNGMIRQLSASAISTMTENAKTAALIYRLAEENNGVLRQAAEFSPFGRLYLKGINLQNCHKMVRHAALGNCVLVDIVASTYRWRYTEAKRLQPHRSWAHTKNLLNDRTEFRERIAKLIGISIDDAKEMITAIGFGADLEKQAWPTGSGSYTMPALTKILARSGKLAGESVAILEADENFMDFLNEQKEIVELIIGEYQSTHNRDEFPAEVIDKGNRLNKNKLMAYLYQQTEMNWQMQLVNHLTRQGHEVMLTVHDGIYLKSRPNMQELQSVLVDENSNMIGVTIDHEMVNGYARVHYDRVDFVEAHKQHIKQEEAAAKAKYNIQRDEQMAIAFNLMNELADGIINFEDQDLEGQNYISELVTAYFTRWDLARQRKGLSSIINGYKWQDR